MWRMLPLMKMMTRMVGAGIALAALYGVALRVAFGTGAAGSWSYWLRSAIESGAFAGLAVALPMALATLLFFREIKRPLFYRFSMATVSLVVVMHYWQSLAGYYHEELLSPGRDRWTLIMFALGLGFYTLLVYASGLAARAYQLEFSARKLARQERETKVDRISR